MDQRIDITRALLAIDRIQRHGELREGQHHWRELHVIPSHDDYSVGLSDGRVTLTIMFHQSYQLDCPTHDALEQFVARVDRAIEGE